MGSSPSIADSAQCPLAQRPDWWMGGTEVSEWLVERLVSLFCLFFKPLESPLLLGILTIEMYAEITVI